jgi:hypothetical protein
MCSSTGTKKHSKRRKKPKKSSPILKPKERLFNDASALYFPVIDQENRSHLIFHSAFTIKLVVLKVSIQL